VSEAEYLVFVGVDWATEAHQVCVLGTDRRVLLERRIDHDAGPIAKLIEDVVRLAEGKAERVAVAIETPHGSLVEAFLAAQLHVYSVNPKQLDRFRDRHTVAGAKDDRRDAFVIADSVRTDRECFRRVAVDDPLVIQLREALRMEEEIKLELGRATNQLRDAIYRYLPGLLPLCPAADEPWFWDLVDFVKTPERARGIGPGSITKILKKYRIRRLTVAEVRGVLRAEPIPVAPGVVEAMSMHVEYLVPRLRMLKSQRQHCEERSQALLDQLAAKPEKSEESSEGNKREHRDVEILLSLPGVGRLVAATMLAEASQALKARDYHALRTQAGVAPVTLQTGKQSSRRGSKRHVAVVMRHACNHRLRDAIHHWTNSSATHDEHSKALYAAARARGHTHGRALRGLADRLLGVLVAMLRDDTLYDAAHFAA
jgi:transposase